MRYAAAITGIPHTAAGLAAIRKLRARGYATRKRARGPRAGGGGPRRPWDQDLPTERATHFTVYQTATRDSWRVSGYQRAHYMGTTEDGKVRLRCTADDRSER